MKTRLLLAFLLTSIAQAQTTHMVNWFFGVSEAAASMEIAQGDSVMWMVTDAMPHTVTSTTGAAHTFDSGILTNGQSFTQEFNSIGTSPYVCSFHPNMTGTISVSALGVNPNQLRSFSIYPNPVVSELNISGATVIDRISVIDANGKAVIDTALSTPDAKIYMDNFPIGNYFVRVTSGGKTQTIKIQKK